MPIYEYLCKNCGHHLEAIQGFNDVPLVKCPECKKAKLEKQISAPAFHLKGTGWYVTDFKDSGKKKASNDESESKSKLENNKVENNTESKTENKVESKKETKDTKAKSTEK